MATTTRRRDGEAILAAVLADPADDLPRLAYADWLEEAGGEAEAARAAFIRNQLAAAATGLVDCPDRPTPPGDRVSVRCGLCRFCLPAAEAWRIHCDQTPSGPPWFGALSFPFAIAQNHWSLYDGRPGREYLTLHLWRGFVDCASGPLGLLLRHGAEIARSHPVARLEASCRRPDQFSMVDGEDEYGWWDAGSYLGAYRGGGTNEGLADAEDLPPALWGALGGADYVEGGYKFYAAADAARRDLSDALLALARAGGGT